MSESKCIVPVPDRYVKPTLIRYGGTITVLAAYAGMDIGNRYEAASNFANAVLKCDERTPYGECNAGCNGSVCPRDAIESLRKQLVKGVIPDPGNDWR